MTLAVAVAVFTTMQMVRGPCIEVEAMETTTLVDTTVLADVGTMTMSMVTDIKREVAVTNAPTRMMATPEIEPAQESRRMRRGHAQIASAQPNQRH